MPPVAPAPRMARPKGTGDRQQPTAVPHAEGAYDYEAMLLLVQAIVSKFPSIDVRLIWIDACVPSVKALYASSIMKEMD